MTSFSLHADTITGQDILDRLESLKSELDDLKTELDDANQSVEIADEGEEAEAASDRLIAATRDLASWHEDNDEEVATIEEVVQYVGEDTLSEETLIAEDHFERYAEELADDLGYTDSNARWPLTHIDWAAAAEELKHDYNTVEIDGTDYHYRSN